MWINFSDKDKHKVAKGLLTKDCNEAVEVLISIFSKVKMGDKEVTALVEDMPGRNRIRFAVDMNVLVSGTTPESRSSLDPPHQVWP